MKYTDKMIREIYAHSKEHGRVRTKKKYKLTQPQLNYIVYKRAPVVLNSRASLAKELEPGLNVLFGDASFEDVSPMPWWKRLFKWLGFK